MLPKTSSHKVPIDFERLSSSAYDLSQAWGQVARAGTRPPADVPDVPNRIVDPQLIRDVYCVVLREALKHRDVNVLRVHTARPHKETSGGFVFYVNDFCGRAFGAKSRKRHDVMARLEEAAEKADERAFTLILREIDWAHKSPDDITRAIKLAFRAGVPTAAQHIYAEGVLHHPDAEGLQKYARLFAPIRKSIRRLPPEPTVEANRQWLKSHRSDYSGKWVAVRNGELLGTAASLTELIEQVGDTPNILLTKA